MSKIRSNNTETANNNHEILENDDNLQEHEKINQIALKLEKDAQKDVKKALESLIDQVIAKI